MTWHTRVGVVDVAGGSRRGRRAVGVIDVADDTAMVGEVAGADARRSMENEREGHGQRGLSARNGGEAYLSAWAVM